MAWGEGGREGGRERESEGGGWKGAGQFPYLTFSVQIERVTLSKSQKAKAPLIVRMYVHLIVVIVVAQNHPKVHH